ncbi:hypothetical protein [Variovorax sp. YR216]|uniref:hypothetical protein n=1 Tax=Variovorax sp. YR216 TaxID=1882828 RepID=UPI00115FBBD6|nr:hypothetical protein [Variovorax sp. YR216]
MAFAKELIHDYERVTGDRERFSRIRELKKPSGIQVLDEWLQVARSRFLGVLHVDEVQNLFKLAPLRTRTRSDDRQELSIVEDKLLLWIQKVVNLGQLAVAVSGTHDGVSALFSRFSTAQKLTTAGYHEFGTFRSVNDPMCKLFFKELSKYQYFAEPMAIDATVQDRLLELTGGVLRLIITLWRMSHRRAFERLELEENPRDVLELNDFEVAAQSAPQAVRHAVAALRSGDTAALARYEDMARTGHQWGDQ